MFCAGCAPTRVLGPQLPAIWSPSPNFGDRRPSFIIIHHTGSTTFTSALKTLTSTAAGVSAHYLIDRNGALHQLVDERHRAWHAGDARWGSDSDLNSASIGIELVNAGDEPFPSAQIDTLLALLQDLVVRYRLPRQNILGHGDVAPRRKVDPNRLFPWGQLAERGFGLWCEPDAQRANVAGANALVADPVLALQTIGYDTSDPRAAWIAWRRHFRPQASALVPVTAAAASDEPAVLFDADDRRLIACLLERLPGTQRSATTARRPPPSGP
jgi:N-acetylmuramoyl-L-alanine amidase